jgi:hypothetical protein
VGHISKRPGALARAVSLLACLALTPEAAHAYLDPGSGSMLLYALAGIGATLAYTVRGLFYRLSSLLTGTGTQYADRIKGIDLVFYSEGRHYWHVFLPVIDALCRSGHRCAYLTSDAEDMGLQYESPLVTVMHIGGPAMSAAVLNHLVAAVVVMTTPQLGIFSLKRSRHVRHYCHLIHAPTDALLYKRYAFDHFDSVMCSGPHQIGSIRALEDARGTPRKRLFETGCTYYDVMLDRLPGTGPQAVQKTILIAPTWGNNGLLARFGSSVIQPLLKAGYAVILRPHPQSYVSEQAMMRALERELTSCPNMTIDRSHSGAPSMQAADIMISDLSGIIFDFAFVFSKPVLVVDCTVERAGFEAEYVDGEIWEITARKRIGRLIGKDDLGRLPSIVESALLSHPATAIERFRNQSVYNFGHAGGVAAAQLVGILQDQSGDVAIDLQASTE